MRRSAVAFVVFAAAAMGQTGVIKGTVADDVGAPIVGAAVTAGFRSSTSPAPAPTRGLPRFMPLPAKALSDSKGAFEIDNVLEGTYALCVWVPDRAYLDPCFWDNKPVLVDVGPGRTVSNVAVTAAKGVVVKVRVQDAGGLLAANPSKDDVRVGTFRGNGPFIPALVSGRDATGKTMSLVVPPGQSIPVSISSTAFALADGNGTAIAAAGAEIAVASPATVTVAPGTLTQPAVTVHVTGAAARQP